MSIDVQDELGDQLSAIHIFIPNKAGFIHNIAKDFSSFSSPENRYHFPAQPH